MGLQRDDITVAKLLEARAIILGGPRDKFTAAEVRSERLHTALAADCPNCRLPLAADYPSCRLP